MSLPSPPSAPVVFIQTIAHQVNQGDVESLIQSQKHMLLRFEKTNEMLVNCNSLSTARFEVTSRELKKHTQLLLDMKKDLDSVFRRIRFLKMKLSQSYPEAFSSCSKNIHVVDEEEEQPEEAKPKTGGHGFKNNQKTLEETNRDARPRLRNIKTKFREQHSSSGSNSPTPISTPASSDSD